MAYASPKFKINGSYVSSGTYTKTSSYTVNTNLAIDDWNTLFTYCTELVRFYDNDIVRYEYTKTDYYDDNGFYLGSLRPDGNSDFTVTPPSGTVYDSVTIYCAFIVRGGGYTEYEASINVRTVTAPGNPTLSSQNGRTVTMTWTAGSASTGTMTYWLLDYTDDQTYGSRQSGTSLTFTIPTSLFGTTHSWRVMYYIDGVIAGTTSGRNITLSTPAISAPTLRISGGTSYEGKDIVLTWNAPTKTAISGTTYYDVYIGGTKHNSSALSTTGYTVSNATSYTSNTTIYVKATLTNSASYTVNSQSNNVTYKYKPGYHTLKFSLDGQNWVEYIPYAVVNNQWVQCDPYVAVNSNWVACSHS